MDRTYRVVLDPDPEEGGYTVTVPAVPGVVTQGVTIEQCLERVQEAIELHLTAMAEGGEPIEIELDKGHAEPTLRPLARALTHTSGEATGPRATNCSRPVWRKPRRLPLAAP